LTAKLVEGEYLASLSAVQDLFNRLFILISLIPILLSCEGKISCLVGVELLMLYQKLAQRI